MLSVYPSNALDLPVKEVDGVKYYVYQTRRGDSLADVAASLGVSREDIVSYNPSAADGIKFGQLLMFPVDVFSSVDRDGHVLSMHTVARGESLFGIAYRYGLTPEDIIAQNPQASAGIKPGDVLQIPLGQTEPQVDEDEPVVEAVEEVTIEDEPVDEPVDEPTFIPQMPEQERRLRPVDVPVVQLDPEQVAEIIAEEEMAEVDATEEEVQKLDPAIALLLPFMLDEEQPSHSAQLFTDFYKGFLMAADTLSGLRGETLSIRAFDTAGDTDCLAKLLEDPAVNRAAVIVAPELDAQLRMIADMAAINGNHVFNIFNVKDTTYVDNPYVLQANIPTSTMYEKAVDGLMDSFDGYTPVILTNKGGQAEKAPFVDYLRSRYAERRLEVVDVVFEGSLHNSAFDSLEVERRYVIIPSSGSSAEFNKISHVLRNLRNTRGDAELTRVFGYPDWLAFRGDALQMLHSLEATIFSRFYHDPNSVKAERFADTFRRWYGVPMISTVPSQAILGFDTGCFLIKALRESDGKFQPDVPATYLGMQSCFGFERHEDGGWYNDTLFIINFLSDKLVSARVI